MPNKKKYPKRDVGTRARGVQARIGGVGAGKDPFSKAPRTLPQGAVPRLKPKGTATVGGRKISVQTARLMQANQNRLRKKRKKK